MGDLNAETESGTPDAGATADASEAAEVATPQDSSSQSDAEALEAANYAKADAAIDAMFGLPPEEKESDDTAETAEKSSDVTKVTDPPVPRQDAEVKKDSEKEAEAKDDKKPEAEAEEAVKEPDTKDGQFKPNEKLNWDDEKVPFRAEFKNLKEAYTALLDSSVEARFITEPVEFKKWMEETSPTSYTQVGAQIATESAQKHPKEWVEYLVKNNPDMVAEIASGREGMTLDRLKAELEVILDDEDEEVQAALEKNQALAAKDEKPAETPEQKEIREWREERKATARAKTVSEVFQPIESEVDALVSRAGLEIKESDYQGKSFTELDEDTQYKVMINEMIPLWIDHRIKQDPKLRNMQARLEEFIEKDDIQSAKNLQHPAQIAVTNFANEFLALATGKRAAAKKSETEPPTKEPPKTMVKSAGSGNGFVPDDKGDLDWTGQM